MAVNVTGHGFSTELEAPPKSIIVSSAECGHLGFTFADFAYDEGGRATVWVDGVQIGACLSPRGVFMGHDADRHDLDRDTIIVRTPGSVSTSGWRDGFHGQFLVFAPEAIERFFHTPLNRVAFEGRDIVVAATERPVIAHLLAAVSSELAAGNPGGPIFTESLSAAALRSIIRVPLDSKRSTRGLTTEQAKALRDLIHARALEPLSLIDLATTVSLSVGHMLRAFKITFGVTPHQYIIRQRVDRAVELLKTTTVSVDEIAQASGFGTRAQMTRTFRAVLGLLPKDVR